MRKRTIFFVFFFRFRIEFVEKIGIELIAFNLFVCWRNENRL